MESVKIDDILDYDFYSNLEISNDEKYLAYNKARANLDKNKYQNYLYLFDIENEKSYKIDNYQGLYIFDENDDLIYLKKSDKDYDYFYKKEKNMSAPCLHFRIDKNVSYIKSLEDGLFFIKASDKTKDSFYQKFDSLPFYANGDGFLKNEALYILDINKDELKKNKRI